MAGRVTTLSVNFGLLLCLFLILNGIKQNKSSTKPLSNSSNLYFASQEACRIKIQSFHSLARRPAKHQAVGAFQKGFITCKLILHGSLALALIALAGDVELNPGYRSLEDVRSSRGLRLAHLNIRSLRNKSDSLRLEGLDNRTIDILTLSETWLDDCYEDSHVIIPGYNCIRLDRSGAKEGFGGVAIYVKEGLPFRVRNDLYSAANECLWIELSRTKCRPVLICCAYRAPGFDFANFISNLEISMTKVNLEKCDFVLLGDLNANMLPFSRKKEKQELKKFATSHDLTQLITEATRVTETCQSLLDVILVNNDHRINDSGVVPVSLSDHYLVYCVLKAGVIKAPPKTIEYRSYKNFDANTFLADLNNVPWHIIENEEDIDDAVFIWNHLFSEIADLHAPVKRRRIRGVPLPWLNDTISEVMKDRDFHHRKAVKTNSAFHWARYRKLRNRVNREVKAAKSKYYCDLILEAKGDSGKIWKAVNEVSSRKTKSSSPQCIVVDGVEHTTPASIASVLNCYFSSIGRSLANKISAAAMFPVRSATMLQSFSLDEVDEKTVLKHLLSLKTNKAIGLDNISARLLKYGARAICPSITKLLNLSIRTGNFPEIWKCSKVAALFKTGDRRDASNYRPISILPTMSKILEKVVHSQFYDILNSNNLLSSKQFGFRPKLSTTSALTSFADEVLLHMESGELCGAVFLDLTKAFDTVDHTILLSKLSAINVSPSTLQWFKSYLNHRKQRTACSDAVSDPLPMTFGVPQGSILGPLLFLVYINDLPLVIKNCEVTLYADDTVLYYFAKEPHLLEEALNDDLLKVAQWLHGNKLTLNLTKTKSMIIGSNRKLVGISSFTLSIFDTDINSVSSFKYLGVMLSSTFTWSDHIEYISCKVNKNLGLLRRIKYYLPYDARLLFYNSLVLPIFDYADLVWGDKDNVSLMKELQILQNKAAKLILDRSPHSSSTDALIVLRWLNLEERRKCHRCIYAYKCINGQLNHSLDIVRKSDIHSYNTRNNDTIKLPKIKYNWGKQRSRYHCFKDFNELERTVRNSASFPIFKKCLFSAFYN